MCRGSRYRDGGLACVEYTGHDQDPIFLRITCVQVYQKRKKKTHSKTCMLGRAVDVRLPGKGNSNSHGARPVDSNRRDD